MAVIEKDIQFSGVTYELVDQADTARLTGQQLSHRNWSEELKRVATQVIQRADVQPGDESGTLDITWDDWSHGSGGVDDAPIGTLNWARYVNGLIPGTLMPTFKEETFALTVSSGTTNNMVGHLPGTIARLANSTFLLVGNVCYLIGATVTVDKDFGGTLTITDAEVHNSELVVGLGAGAKIWKRDTAGNWTQASNNTYVMHMAEVNGRLWDSQGDAGSEANVRNIGPTDNPLTLANHSTGITVGTAGVGVTDLTAYGQQLLVSKPDGLYPGDAGAIFQNVLEDMVSLDVRNGYPTARRGADVFFPHSEGLLMWNPGSVTEVGLRAQFTSGNPADQLPGAKVSALAVQGQHVYMAMEAGGFPRANPTAVQITTDGSTYTDITSGVTDSDSSGAGSSASKTYWVNNPSGFEVIASQSVFGSLATLADNDWFVVGYSAPFYGVLFDLGVPNTTAAVHLRVDFWNGGWVQMTTSATYAVVDNTTLSAISTPSMPGTTLGRSGLVTWTLPTGWITQSLNGVSAYYVRFSFDAQISSGTTIGEIRVLTASQDSYIYRSRNRTYGDVGAPSPIVWEPLTIAANQGQPNVIALTAPGTYPSPRGTALMTGSQLILSVNRLTANAVDNGIATGPGGQAAMGLHDAGLPDVPKQWLSMTIRGGSPPLSPTRPVSVSYRLDQTSGFTEIIPSVSANVTSASFASGTTGYAMQPMISFGVWTAADGQLPRVIQMQARCRPLWPVKREFTYLIKLEESDQVSVKVYFEALEALVGAAAVAHVDPLHRGYIVNVVSMGASELYETGEGIPALAVPLRCVEV